jgi:ATP-dependent protease Clp ATPase subunit
MVQRTNKLCAVRLRQAAGCGHRHDSGAVLAICNECVTTCVSVLDAEGADSVKGLPRRRGTAGKGAKTPTNNAGLDEYVIGGERSNSAVGGCIQTL